MGDIGDGDCATTATAAGSGDAAGDDDGDDDAAGNGEVAPNTKGDKGGVTGGDPAAAAAPAGANKRVKNCRCTGMRCRSCDGDTRSGRGGDAAPPASASTSGEAVPCTNRTASCRAGLGGGDCGGGDACSGCGDGDAPPPATATASEEAPQGQKGPAIRRTGPGGGEGDGGDRGSGDSGSGGSGDAPRPATAAKSGGAAPGANRTPRRVAATDGGNGSNNGDGDMDKLLPPAAAPASAANLPARGSTDTAAPSDSASLSSTTIGTAAGKGRRGDAARSASSAEEPRVAMVSKEGRRGWGSRLTEWGGGGPQPGENGKQD